MARNVLVTGASGGIGGAVARRFALAGDTVMLGYHHGREKAQALCRQLQQQGCAALAAGADVTKPEEVDALFAGMEGQFGPVDVLVTCAGLAQQKLLADITDEDWRSMMAVNCDGVFYCCRRALPAMIRRKQGCIINISSMWGQVGASCEAHYSAAKGAVIALTKALAKENGPSGVRVNGICPGAVDTDMLAGFDEADRAALCAETPLGRLGLPADVAGAAFFLASEDAAFITGQILGVNGGFVI